MSKIRWKNSMPTYPVRREWDDLRWLAEYVGELEFQLTYARWALSQARATIQVAMCDDTTEPGE